VEVNVVIRRSSRVKPKRWVRLLAGLSVATTLTTGFDRGTARAEDAGPTAEAGAARTALQTLLEQLVSNDRNMRRAAARSIEAIGPAGTSAMAEDLAKLRPGRPSAEVLAVLARAHGTADAAETLDRLDALLDLPPQDADAAYAQTVVTLCVVRALARTATPDAVAAFVPVALDAHGAFAPDVTRHLTALGERATAGLVLASHGHSPVVGKWAASELEALGTRTPGDAVQTKSKEVLADVLTAYGTVHDADALSVVMSFVNADRRLVRDAAREALVRYGDVAVPKLRETYGLLSGEAPPLDWPAAWLRKKLFEALDRVRLEDVDARVRTGLAMAEAGHFAEAVADFDDVLARQPDWDRKSELVPAYVFDAQALLATDKKLAATVFEKALALDPAGPRAAQIKSALALLEGEALEARGVTDEEPFRRALALDPSNEAAAAALERMNDAAGARRKAWERRFIEAGAALGIISALILFVGPRRRGAATRRRR
jgi:tetratricopeptide (TPR) repeat protein